MTGEERVRAKGGGRAGAGGQQAIRKGGYRQCAKTENIQKSKNAILPLTRSGRGTRKFRDVYYIRPLETFCQTPGPPDCVLYTSTTILFVRPPVPQIVYYMHPYNILFVQTPGPPDGVLYTPTTYFLLNSGKSRCITRYVVMGVMRMIRVIRVIRVIIRVRLDQGQGYLIQGYLGLLGLGLGLLGLCRTTWRRTYCSQFSATIERLLASKSHTHSF